ncbi:MAG: DnaJ C-terminal domain-containing protein [Acidiferrobacter sp.]
MRYKDYYAIMGVERGASADDIKRAYRKLARKYHPDVSKEPHAEDRFKEIGEAYEVLRDPEKRTAYDQLGSNWRPDQDFTPPPGWQAGGGHAHRSQGFDGAQFSDFFESVFGGNFRRGMRGGDEHAHLSISLEEAYGGTTRAVRLSVPPRDGHGAPNVRTLNVRIPAGIQPGQQIRLAGQGNPGVGEGGAGDLYLEIDIAAHPHYRLEGRDLSLTVPVAPWEAALGATLAVPTLGGKVEVRLPAGSQTGQRLRLRGRGMPGQPPGDQYVVVEIVNPRADSDRAQALYRQMAQELAFNPRAHLEA